ncbi:MAG: DEAD/DEAH box helicase [Deltaproteobacteria bacterium]|nr:DEAD/DEAH box helicase [Candidatus Zymogenaceae bacterium]
MPKTKTTPDYDIPPSHDIAPVDSFEDLDLDKRVLSGIRDMGFSTPSEIQKKALPYTLAGYDLIGQAQTGTGKTAAFLIAIFQRLLKDPKKSGTLPRALIITPTRELAVQIEREARDLGAHTGLTVTAIFGGVDYREQADTLRKGVDIVVGTPGRLIDYMKQGILKTAGVEILVIDEADRLLDMGFIKDLRFVLKKLPPLTDRQTLLFSATITFSVVEATYHFMKIPVEVSATPESITVEEVTQELYHVSRREKFRLLLGLIGRIDSTKILVFANTKSGVLMIKERLTRNGFSAQALSGDIPQRKRLKILERFMKGEIRVLIGTDVASRGLHIEDVDCVILYDIPQNPEDYVHRIGRTARAGKSGVAISLATEDDAYYLEPIEHLIGRKIPFRVAEESELGEESQMQPQHERERNRDRKTARRKRW